jgi:predicted nucleic acid-binding protein
MNPQKILVLDANILIRAVLGRRVRQILRKYANDARFCSPADCFADARKYIAHLAQRKGIAPTEALTFLKEIETIVQPVDDGLYQSYEQNARRRIDRRDPDDWPIVAVAMLFNCPIWTEDRDFFGAGIATWTTDRVELYLRERF